MGRYDFRTILIDMGEEERRKQRDKDGMGTLLYADRSG